MRITGNLKLNPKSLCLVDVVVHEDYWLNPRVNPKLNPKSVCLVDVVVHENSDELHYRDDERAETHSP